VIGAVNFVVSFYRGDPDLITL